MENIPLYALQNTDMEDGSAFVPHGLPAEICWQLWVLGLCRVCAQEVTPKWAQNGAGRAGQIPKVVMRQPCRYQQVTPCRWAESKERSLEWRSAPRAHVTLHSTSSKSSSKTFAEIQNNLLRRDSHSQDVNIHIQKGICILYLFNHGLVIEFPFFARSRSPSTLLQQNV